MPFWHQMGVGVQESAHLHAQKKDCFEGVATQHGSGDLSTY